ncbi:MAG: c-type cytochrome [Acidimicrobiia bacterium]
MLLRNPGRASRLRALLVLVAVVFALAAPAGAQSTDTTAPAETEGSGVDGALLQAGFEAYTNSCSGCHQAGGVGLEGTFPPLIDNANVMDTEYLVGVINNGLQGEITVDGVTYNGVMPAFSTLSDAEVESIVAYIQSGFVVPAGEGAETGTALPLVTGSLPDLSGMAIFAAFAVAAAAIAFVMAPRIIAANDRLTMPWLDAWLRVAIITVFFIVVLAFVPSMILQTETVGRLPRVVQETITLALWGGGFAAGVWGLWYAHRDGRI